jgi:hypothetical protein
MLYRATNKAGNIGLITEQTTHFRLDKTPPVIFITSPLAQTYLHNANMTIAWTATDAISGIDSVQAQLDGDNISNNQTIDLLTLTLGNHKIPITATDQAGNTTMAEVNFTITASIDSLIAATQYACNLGWISNNGVCNSLQAKLNVAKDSLARGNKTAAKNQLNALLHELDAQKGKKVNQQAYDLLSTDAKYVILFNS